MNPGTIGCAVSHLKAIKKWYDETDESYAFFCEDDLSLETVEYWNFTWEEFVESIPEDADCVQLLCLRESGSFSDFRFRRREWNDWSVTAYIITRDYAEKIIKNHKRNHKKNHQRNHQKNHQRNHQKKHQRKYQRNHQRKV